MTEANQRSLAASQGMVHPMSIRKNIRENLSSSLVIQWLG